MNNVAKEINATDKTKIKPTYLILGSGSFGFALAKELRELDKELIIVDKDSQKVETLREEAYEALVGDVSDPNLFEMINTKNLAGILILSSDPKANKIALKNVREKVSPDIYCVVRAPDVINMQEMETIGADLVIMPPRMVAKSLSRSLERAEAMRRGNKLTQWFETNKGKKLGIVVHDNPDPDAISSALALKTIASSFNVLADIIYHGEIGHQENKAFVNLLGIDLFRSEDVGFTNYENLALVDCSMPGANNSLPLDTHVNIIIDHHPLPDADIDADFIDIRPHVGASATILTKYLQELNIDIDSELATALLYGIRTDTLDFKRNTDSSDLSAASYLYPLSDHDILEQLERPSMSIETLDVLGEAINSRQVIGSYLLSNVGSIRNRDTLPQAADYLLNLEGISTSIVFGVTEEKIYISGRSNDIRVNLGDVMKRAFGEDAGGGHATAAAAQIPLGVFSASKDRQTLLRLVNEAVVKRFLAAVGVEENDE
ncbi:DHH family phosphoesterase [Methanolobus sp. WCC1]|uniref:Exopolyphosphatase-like enzyme n=1 Tax=Methanolobus tindarius DSM 2278 TaxID=1090322 RepID=W9DR89_METTI|nr:MULTISPECIES: DHH family phosphoesterase [Methanolobus]ETA68178.1 exopolyphosphatase-like enzyme [Methanolobus tindarius DSM 2278]